MDGKSGKLVRGLAGLRERFGITLGFTQLWTDVREGRFPAPLKLNDSARALFWDEAEIIAWIEARKRARDEALAALHESAPAE